MPKPPIVLKAEQIAAAPEYEFSHPLNPNSKIFMKGLGLVAGFERTGITIARVPPGRESFALHAHRYEEEWIYILSGRGRVQVGDEYADLEPGDFVPFHAGGPAHNLCNVSEHDDLVYLMGGEKRPFELVTFPEARKKLVRDGDLHYMIDEEQFRPFSFAGGGSGDDSDES